MTAEGWLYEVDMRLRPSGNQGPVAVAFDSFVTYHQEHSWTWERMALTRARVISAPPALRKDIELAIRDALTRPLDPATILADARAMREKLAVQFPGHDIWDIKFAAGGLVDIEFIAQTLMLCHAADESRRARSEHHRGAAEAAGRRGRSRWRMPKSLIAAARLEHGVTQVLRIALDGPFNPDMATKGLKTLLARAGHAPSFASLEAQLAETQTQVRAILNRLIPVR